MSDSVKIQLVVTFGAITMTWLTVKYRNVITNKNRIAAPKDRMETIFEGYEKLIVQQQQDIERKTHIIEGLEEIVDKLRKDLDNTTVLLERARMEVTQAKEQNKEMSRQLATIKQDYSGTK